MSVLDAIILGIVQGLTEFLPISSSGHLVLGKHILGFDEPGFYFEVALHLATALAVVIHYRMRIRAMLVAPFMPSAENRRENLGLIGYIVLGTIPAVVIGFTLKDTFEKLFSNPHMVSIMLLVTGGILMASRFARNDGQARLGWLNSLIIGISQALAIVPGISRSGTTIVTGLFLKLPPAKVAEFSFILSLPAILGAGILTLKDALESGTPAGIGAVAFGAGCLAAFISGYLSIIFLLKVLEKGRFDRFAWYCWAVGMAGILFT